MVVIALATGAFILHPRKPPCFHVDGRHALVFRGARVFDGENILSDTDVLVVDGTIAAVGTLGCIDPGSAKVEDVETRGDTLLPGLIDAHTHRGEDEEALAAAVTFGVTTEIDMGGSRPERLAEIRAKDDPKLADAFGAGMWVTAPGGHGTEYGGAPGPTLARNDDADAFVAARIAEGSQFIKLIISSELPTLNAEQTRAVVTAAHARDRRVVAHVNTRADAEVAVDAGVDGLAHLFIDRLHGKLRNGTPVGWDREAAQRLVEDITRRHIFVIPTLGVLQSACGIAPGKSLLGDSHIGPRLSDRARRSLSAEGWGTNSDRDCYEHLTESVSLLRGAVPILAGTDAGNRGVTHGASLHRELELLVKAGLTPLEALRAATSAPAAAFESIKERGHIAVGARADLLLVEGDPTQDILATRAILRVYKHGVQAL